MRRVRVLNPITSIEEVQASLDTFGGRIADRLDARRPLPEDGGDTPSASFRYRDVFDDLGHDLESLRLKVIGAEDERVRRLARATAVRRQADELKTGLQEQQVAIRKIFGGAYDSGRDFELAAISGETPRTLKALEEQVDQTVKLLREPVVDEPTVKVSGVDIDFGKVADGLESMLKDLRQKRAELDRLRKALGESKVLVDQALEEFRASFPWVAQALEAYARWAGERELADRIRTSIRRVTRRQGEESDQGSAGETPSEEPPSEETASEDTSPDEAATSQATADEATADETAAAVES